MNEQSITQFDVGEIAGVSQSAVSRWLLGMKPHMSRVRRIAIHYDLDDIWLMFGKGEKRLTLTERLARDDAKASRTERAREFVTNVEGKRRAIYIQDQPKQPLQELRFDHVSDELWAIVTKFILEQSSKRKGNR